MWRTVTVNQGEKLTVRSGWLVVYSGELEQKVPIDDIYALVLENGAASVSVSVLTELALAGAHVYCCDRKHLPVSVSLPLNTYHKPLLSAKRQIEMPQQLKEELWEKVIRQKIRNQALCLRYRGLGSDDTDPLFALASDVRAGDISNREAVAAKKYFRSLFGPLFKRSDVDDVTNMALNYGYSIMRSSVGKSVAVHGYNGALGIHHVNENNPFNLADDLMEPLRPLVDLWTDSHCDELLDCLTSSNRRELITLVNMPVLFDGKKMRVRYAIDLYVRSLTSAINAGDADLLILPELLALDRFFEDDLDG